MTGHKLLSLALVDTAAIEASWRHVQGMPAKLRVQEDDIESELLRETLEPLLGQPAWLVASLLEAVLAERGSFEAATADVSIGEVISAEPAAPRIKFRAARSYGSGSPELVWSGATFARSCARSTRQAIEDLFASVEKEVFIAGYSFDHASDLFGPLFTKSSELLAEGREQPRVRVVLDCSRFHASGNESPEEIAREVHNRFRKTCWSDPDLVPEVRYLEESTERTPKGFAPFSMHAKCIIVDRNKAMVGSANFSNRGRDRNLEVGAIIRDYHFVQTLCSEWEALWPRLVRVVE